MGPGQVRASLEIAHNAFVSLDAGGRITEWNPRAEKLFGFTRQEALGRELAELVVPAQYREPHRQALAAAARRGAAAPVGTHHPVPLLHVEACHRDGTQFPTDLSVTTVSGPDGVSFHGWIQDVSERAELLAELQSQLRSGAPGLPEILDALAEAVTIRDPHHHILFANRRALDMMGFRSLAELQRHPPQAILSDYIVHDEQGRELAMEDLPSVRLLSGESQASLLIRVINRHTGELRWQLMKSSGLHNADGRLVAAVTIIEDVTEAKSAELRERFLARATETLMSSLDYEQTLRNVAALAVPELADWCAVDLVDERGRRQRVAVAHQDPQKLDLAARLRAYEPEVPDPESGLGRVLRTGVGELVQDIPEGLLEEAAQDDEHLRLLRALELRSALIVPLRARERALGAITLVTAGSARRLQPADLEFALALASRAAVAVDNARLATSRRQTAATLQRSLMPEVVPEIGGWEIATLYRPAGGVEEVEVGGDFYDFVRTEDGWLVLLGDVAGKGAEAAAMTSLMRYGARFIGRDQPSPSQILARLNEVLHEQPEMWLVTALCVRLGQDSVVVSSAGHPAPLVVCADGQVLELGTPGPILGAWSDVRHVERSVRITGDQTLFLYTDGVIDTESRTERFGLPRLRQVLGANAAARPRELLSALERSLESFQHGAQADDTAAVALRPQILAPAAG